MTVTLTGYSLTIDELLRVARHGEQIEFGAGVLERMQEHRQVVDNVLERGDTVYGLNTGLGVLKRAHIPRDDIDAFQKRTLGLHALADGPRVAGDVGRALVLRHLNGFATGAWGVRPDLAIHLRDYLNSGGAPTPRSGASLHVGACLALEVLGDFVLAPNEALALLNMGASDGALGLTLHDATVLIDAMEVSAALSFEAFAGQSDHLHPAVTGVLPKTGFSIAADRIRRALAGSFIWEKGAARNLQDPVSFRAIAHVLGGVRDALSFATTQIEAGLNGMAGNPIVVVEEDRMISAANWDGTALALGTDTLTLALKSAYMGSQERSIKLLDEFWSGLPSGLTAEAAVGESGLAMYQMNASGNATRAAELAMHIPLHGTSTSQAEGIEDISTGPDVSRLKEMIQIGVNLVAIELLVSAQAVELRGSSPLGTTTSVVFSKVRAIEPFVHGGEPIASDLTRLRELILSGHVGTLATND
ncbi:aromatic amino acid lyase [Conyzicola sp.]|uniref:aromatic amino acid lyase n=1 Tax=Conyzicola sp. TaxID=1969404 RepID=UPI00398A30CF